MAQDYRKLLISTITMLIIVGAAASAIASTHSFANGLTVRIHTPDDLADDITIESGARMLRHAGLGSLELLHGTDDPRLPRRDVAAFVPADIDVVADALADLDIQHLELSVDVYVLPAPPAEILSSFARRQAIVLAPGYGAVPAELLAELVVHELGHVMTWAYFDRVPANWERYMELRDLDPATSGPDAAHADRAREILAEDLRYLLGGELANHHHGIENHELALPDQVDGLEAFLRDTVHGRPMLAPTLEAAAWPNPCNPFTTIELRLGDRPAGDAGEARLTILDLRGRVVSTVRGGDVENGSLRIGWDGRGDDGRRVPSGRYAYRIGWSDTEGRGTVTVVR